MRLDNRRCWRRPDTVTTTEQTSWKAQRMTVYACTLSCPLSCKSEPNLLTYLHFLENYDTKTFAKLLIASACKTGAGRGPCHVWDSAEIFLLDRPYRDTDNPRTIFRNTPPCGVMLLWRFRSTKSTFLPISPIYRYSRKSLPFFCSSLTAWPNSTKIGTIIAPGEADPLAKFHRAAFLCCRGTAHERFVMQQKIGETGQKLNFCKC